MPKIPDSDGMITEPPEVTVALDQLNDEINYLLLIANHALVEGPKKVTDIPLPRVETSYVVDNLRNVYEHWTDWHTGVLDHNNRYAWAEGEKNWSGKRLRKTHPHTDPNAYSGTQFELEIVANVLDLRQLLNDLEAIDRALHSRLDEHIVAVDLEEGKWLRRQ